jgi:hypothetical protein
MLEEAVAAPIENASPAANRAMNVVVVVAIVDALALSTQLYPRNFIHAIIPI